MADLLSIARPYAHAAFDYARKKQQLSAWKAFLESASSIARDPAVINVMANPAVSTEKLYSLFHDSLAPLLDTERNNFLLLLAQHKRFVALPDITELFNAYYAAQEKLSSVRIVTAIDIPEKFREKLIQALSKRTHHDVTLHCDINPSIIGGAIIHIGDKVIDGSIRGKLTRLLESFLR